MTLQDLRALERAHRTYEIHGASAPAKVALLRRLDAARLPTPAAVRRLHEVLCFLRAYPDGPEVLAQVERMLAGFSRRPDLRRHAARLQDSGIAGTDTAYRFFFQTARWLAARWPGALTVDWDDLERPEALDRLLGLLALPAEHPGLDEVGFPVAEWVDRLKHPSEGSGTFLVRRLAALPAHDTVRQFLYEDLGLWLRLPALPGAPSRTLAHAHPALAGGRRRIHWQRGAVAGPRPDLLAGLGEPPVRLRRASRREGERLVDLAREAMVTRSRDLDAFAYASPDDVRVADMGGGLEFVCYGVVPERRLLLEAVYGFLTLKNGVPVGYVLNSALFGSAEVAYNVFDTFRGAEAAHIYGRLLALLHHLFGADTFCIFPYQLGHDNDEALGSGAWWFYQKLGFRARDPGVLRLMDAELARMRRRPGHRSTIPALRRLARETVYLHAGPRRDDVIGLLSLPDVGLAVTDRLAERFGADREAGAATCSREAAALLGVGGFRGWSAGERLAWSRWAPLVTVLPGVARWPAADRAALAEVIRAKGARRESEFVRRFDAHARLRAAVRRLAGGGGEA